MKNEISVEISSNLLVYLPKSKFDTIKLFEKKYSGKLSSTDLKSLIIDVYTAYQSKFEAIKRKMEFKKVKEIRIGYYKKKTKYKLKGDIKTVDVEFESTPLSITLSYLIRNGFEGTVEYIQKKLPTTESTKQIKLYQTVFEQIEHFGFEKLYSLALAKRARIIKKYSSPIKFESLSFRSSNRNYHSIMKYNKKYGSVNNAFITLGNLAGYKRLYLPVVYSKKYHGPISQYKEGRDVFYTVCFTDKKRIRIILSVVGEREIPTNKTSYIGVDVNMKRNMLSASTEDKSIQFTVDYDRKLLDSYADQLLWLDELKKKKDYSIGKKRQIKLNTLKRKMNHDVEKKCSEFLKICKSKNIDHLVMENLTGFQNKTFGKDSDTGMKIGRLSKELKISSIKDKMESISRKHDISVSLVHSAYTSQECPECHNIDKENRISQESFVCSDCGYAADADYNSPVNIVRRVIVNVLREPLLKEKYVNSGVFIPRLIKREKVKELLLSHRADSGYKTL